MQYLHEIGHVASDWPLGLVVALACRAGSLSCRAGSVVVWACRAVVCLVEQVACRAGRSILSSLGLVGQVACRAGSFGVSGRRCFSP